MQLRSKVSLTSDQKTSRPAARAPEKAAFESATDRPRAFLLRGAARKGSPRIWRTWKILEAAALAILPCGIPPPYPRCESFTLVLPPPRGGEAFSPRAGL